MEGYYPPGSLAAKEDAERGMLIRVVDTKTTLEALQTIVHQGEGAKDHHCHYSHYHQFARVKSEFNSFKHLIGKL